MSLGKELKIGGFAVLGVALLIGFVMTIEMKKAEGNEALVAQEWREGVLDEVKRDGTHFYIPGFFYDVYRYDIGTGKVTFDDSRSNADAEYPRIVVNVGENGGQEARIAMSVNYRIGHTVDANGSPVFSPKHLVKLHKDGIGKTYESVILKRTIQDVVNEIARPKDALEIFSGAGFVRFKEEIDQRLKTHPVFKNRGIFVENTIVYKVYLDPKYEAEIAAKQQAIQNKLREAEETKAAEERAKRVFAESQANVEKIRQEAEADKVKRIKAAEAEKEEQILQAEGEKQSQILKSEGILAEGRAKAEVQSLLRDAKYAGESGKRRAQVEIAVAEAEKLKGIFTDVKIVPEKTVLMMGDKSMGAVKPTLDME